MISIMQNNGNIFNYYFKPKTVFLYLQLIFYSVYVLLVAKLGIDKQINFGLTIDIFILILNCGIDI